MSKIRFDDWEPQAGGTTVAMSAALVKAWSNYDQVTGPTITDSTNVSSISDDAAGLYTVNLTNAMADADGPRHGQLNDNNASTNSRMTSPTHATTSTSSAQQFVQGFATSETDFAISYSSWIGDLA